MRRWLSAVGLSAAVGVLCRTASAQSSPPTVAPGSTLDNQPFAWQTGFADRWGGAYDSYSIVMSTGVTYTIATSNAGGGSADTFLYLQAADGTVVAQDHGVPDESPSNFVSIIQYPPARGGVFTIKLRAFAQGAAGTCTLSVSAITQHAGTPMLPDMIEWKKAGTYLYDVDIVVTGGRKLLRFSSAPANIGAGPVDFYAVQRPDGTALGYQRIFNTDGTFTDNLITTFTGQNKDGLLFNEWADYNLRQVTAGGGVGAVVAANTKTTFNVADDVHYDGTLPGSPRFGLYPTPTDQGESVGWTDVYAKVDGAGQDVDITAVADGVYWLETTVNPKGLLQESNTGNNTSRLKIQVTGTNVTVLGDDTAGSPPPPPVQLGLDAARAAPNPWRADRNAGGAIVFAPLASGATIRLFNASGRFVRTVNAAGGVGSWDLTDDSGRPVVTGYYIYLLTDSDGREVRGKLAVIR